MASGAYGTMGRTQYSNADIMNEMQGAGWCSGATSGGYGRGGAPEAWHGEPVQQMQQNYSQHGHQASHLAAAPPPNSGSYAQAMDGFPQYPCSYAGGMEHISMGGQPVLPPGFGSPAEPYHGKARMEAAGDYHKVGQDVYEGEMRYGERRVIKESMMESGQEKITKNITGVREFFTREKVIEVPQIYTREFTREVYKPEIIERIIEVPKTEIHERHVVGPPAPPGQCQYQEQIVETCREVVEERVVHVPKKVVQERLIEVPKVDYVERIEYVDYIEYREVPVDKFVEVPEIEYRIREVEQLVPQQYVQEYFVDKYTEVPVTQIQEVERIEHVPVHVPPGYAQQMQQMQQMEEMQRQRQMQSMQQMQQTQQAEYAQYMQSMKNMQSMVQETDKMQSYGQYDPHKAGGPTVPKSLNEIKSAPIGSQFLVPKGTFNHGGEVAGSSANLGSMHAPPSAPMPPQSMGGMMPQSMQSMGGCPTPPMPFGSMPPSHYAGAGNPYASAASMSGHWANNPYASGHPQMTPAY